MEDGVEDNDIIFGYNGEEYTEAAQLQYLRQRHYAPDMGAFTSQDTYRGDLYEPISQNRYTYAGNDPVNYNDPGGDKRNNRSAANKTQMGGSNRRGADKNEVLTAANNALSQALNIGKNLTGNAFTALTNWANAAASTQQGRKSGDGTQRTYRQEQVRSSTEIIKDKYKGLAEKLQSGVECKGDPPNNASPWGTREPAGKRREYKVPIEERPGVWAVGLEGSVSILGMYLTPSFQIVTDVKGKTAIYIGYTNGLNKEAKVDLYETLNPKGWPFSAGGGITYTAVDATDVEAYIYADKMLDIGGAAGRGAVSILRFEDDDNYYYGVSLGTGFYSPDVHAGSGNRNGIVFFLN